MFLRTPILLALLVVIVGTAQEATGSTQDRVQAGDLLTLAAEGKAVYCQDARIIGDLNLSSLPEANARNSLQLINCTFSDANFAGVTFEKDVMLLGCSLGNASFDHCNFLGPADLSDTSFDQASFTGSSFSQPVIFDGALFESPVSFVDSRFEKDASFNAVRFAGDADFNYSSFGYYSYFYGAQFSGNAAFSDVTFAGAADFSGALFATGANFVRSSFEDAASFTDAVFSGPAQFGLAKFQGLTSFGNATFGGEAGFALARFTDAAYFSEAQFQDLALFGLTKFEDIASFQKAQFKGDLNLKGGSISTMLLENAEYGRQSRIILNDTDLGRLKAHWHEIEDHVVWDPGAYLTLVENYRRVGWSPDEDDCYYRYRKLDQDYKGWGWSKIIDIMAWLSCGYGVRPGYAGAWSILTIIAFAGIFWKGDGIRKSAKPLHEPAEKYAVPDKVTLRNALFFSTMIFISRGPNEFLPVGKYRYYVILEGILGWLLLALFLVTLGRVMIR